MKVMVKWGWTDDYGAVSKLNVNWFANEEEANNWVKDMKDKNGGYIRVKTVKEANYEKWLRLVELEKEVAELKKEF